MTLQRFARDAQARPGVREDRAPVAVSSLAIAEIEYDCRRTWTRAWARLVIKTVRVPHAERPAIRDQGTASFSRVSRQHTHRLVVCEDVVLEHERAALVKETTPILGIAATDGQARDQHGRRRGRDVKVSARSPGIDIEHAGARPFNGQALIDPQFAAGQSDRPAVKAGSEDDRVSATGRGDGGT